MKEDLRCRFKPDVPETEAPIECGQPASHIVEQVVQIGVNDYDAFDEPCCSGHLVYMLWPGSIVFRLIDGHTVEVPMEEIR